MGWWNQGSDGTSLHEQETGLRWGDEPADIMDEAVERIAAAFKANFAGDPPTVAEMMAGLQFTLGLYCGDEAHGDWVVEGEPELVGTPDGLTPLRQDDYRRHLAGLAQQCGEV